MTVVACYIAGVHYKTIPKYDSLPPQVASLCIHAISINSAYTSRIMASLITCSHSLLAILFYR